MKKTVIHSTVCILFTVFCTLPLSARAVSGEGEKADYTVGRLGWANLWLNTANPAGLTGDSAFLSDSLRAFSQAALKADFTSGDLKNIYDPVKGITGNLCIDSYMKLGDTFLHGRFGYIYDYGTGYRWRGMTNPYEMPFMLTDSIPGNISNETYTMEAGIGITLGGGWSIGIDARYDAGILAKHKDLRNKNTYMLFDIIPGVKYTSGPFTAGLSLCYLRNTEKVEYKQYVDATEKYIFSLYGMWHYNSTGFSSAEKNRYRQRDEFSGAFQLGLDYSDFRILNEFQTGYTVSSQTEAGTNNLHYGDLRKMRYYDALCAMFGHSHRIDGSFSWSRMNGYRFLQRQELDPYSKIRRWVTYGGPIYCYDRSDLSSSLSYTFRKAENLFDIDWELSAGASLVYMKQNYYESPYAFSQKYCITEPYLRFSKFWKKGKSQVDLAPEASYSIVDGSGYENLITGGDLPEGTNPWQLTEPMHEEYTFFTSDKLTAGLSFRYAYLFRPSSTIFLRAGYHLRHVFEGEMSGRSRHLADFTIGFTF